jgi:virginiamycin B lyase
MRRSLVVAVSVAIVGAVGLSGAIASRPPARSGLVPCAKLKRHHRPLPGRCRKKKVHKPSLPAGARVVARIDHGAALDPMWLAADASAVWLHGPRDIVRVDPASNSVIGRVPTQAIAYGYMAVGAGAVWQADFDDNTLFRIDPAANAVVATIPLGTDCAPEGVGIAGGFAWVACHHQGTVLRIDPATNSIIGSVRVGSAGDSGPLELAVGSSSIWVNVPNANQVVRIDPATGSVVGRVPESGPPIVDGDSVWVQTGTGLDRVDAATTRVIAHIRTAPPTGWGAAGLGAAWVPTSSGLARVDETTNKLVGLLATVPKGDVAVGGDSIWVAAYGKPTLFRVKPLP